MQTHPIHVTHGRERVLGVRAELFAFSEVLEVFITGREDVLVVVCAGRPRPAEWLRALRAAGYETVDRPHARGQRVQHSGRTARAEDQLFRANSRLAPSRF